MCKFINIQVLLWSSLMAFGTAAQAATHSSTINSIEPVQDQVLIEFIRDAVSKHPRVLAEIALVDSRSALERAAGKAIYNPELEFDAESATDDTYSIGLNQTIDFGNKRSARKKVAASEHTLSVSRMASVRKNITIILLNALAGFHSSSQQFGLAGSRLKIVQEFSDLANRRYRAGDISQTELNIANLALAQAQIDYATQKSMLAETEQALRLQSQISSSVSWPQLPTKLPSISTDKLDVDYLVAALPNVRAAQNQVNVFKDLISLRQRERKPDPTVGIRGGEEGSDTLIGINLSIPLFVRNSFNEEVVAAQSEQREAEYRYQNILNSSRTQIIASTKRLQFTQDAWDSWENSGQSSYKNQSELLKRLWEAGELSTTDYLVQLNQILDMQVSATELRNQLWRSWFDWLRASGEIRNWLGFQGL